MPKLHRFGLLLSACALVGCAEQPMRADREVVDLFPEGREVSLDPSYVEVVHEIVQRRGCSGHNCHGYPGGRARLELTEDPGVNYQALVGRMATSEPYLLVSPGVPDSSYLVIKLENRQRVGFAMPLGAEPLDSIDLHNIRNWISAGAKSQ